MVEFLQYIKFTPEVLRNGWLLQLDTQMKVSIGMVGVKWYRKRSSKNPSRYFYTSMCYETCDSWKYVQNVTYDVQWVRWEARIIAFGFRSSRKKTFTMPLQRLRRHRWVGTLRAPVKFPYAFPSSPMTLLLLHDGESTETAEFYVLGCRFGRHT